MESASNSIEKDQFKPKEKHITSRQDILESKIQYWR